VSLKQKGKVTMFNEFEHVVGYWLLSIDQ